MNERKTALIDSDQIVASVRTERVNLDLCRVGSLHILHGASAVVKNMGAIELTLNQITITAHGYYTGLKVAASTTTTLPAPLTATNYYVIRVDADTIKLATSYANAIAGTAIDITDAGTGTHTLTPATKGGSIQIQVSNVDNPSVDADWANKGSAIAISGAAGNSFTEFDQKELAAQWLSINYTHTDGGYALDAILNLKN